MNNTGLDFKIRGASLKMSGIVGFNIMSISPAINQRDIKIIDG